MSRLTSMPALPYTFLLHADWSTSPAKRWAALASRGDRGWSVGGPFQVSSSDELLRGLFATAKHAPVLAGFDFPIGVPAAYGRRTGLPNFVAGLEAFGSGRWAHFYDVADNPFEVSVERPFYPRRSTKDAKQAHLVAAHGVSSIDDLRRECERPSADRAAACSLFWTLGGNQVGKAAIAGWKEIVRPARAQGAWIWPFDGELGHLAEGGGVTIAETYPAEAYAHVGVRFKRARESKTRQHDRAQKAPAIETWAERQQVHFDPPTQAAIRDGFGPELVGEDRFDALLGLLGMIEVVDGRREAAPQSDSCLRTWEGWILGQASQTVALQAAG